jgi:hypothetical protein
MQKKGNVVEIKPAIRNQNKADQSDDAFDYGADIFCYHGNFCHEIPSGGIEVRGSDGEILHNFSPGKFFDCESLAWAALELEGKSCFTAEVKAELFDIAVARARMHSYEESAWLHLFGQGEVENEG